MRDAFPPPIVVGGDCLCVSFVRDCVEMVDFVCVGLRVNGYFVCMGLCGKI